MTANFHGIVTQYTNKDKTFSPTTTCSTLRVLLDELSSHYGESFGQFVYGNETCLFLVNGRGVALSGGLDSPLVPGDKVDILPFVDAG